MTLKVSLERLYHFQCTYCKGWWTVADFTWPDKPGAIATCPHCHRTDTLPETPLTGADFQGANI